MMTLIGFALHGVLAMAGGLLLMRPAGRLTLPLAALLGVLLSGVDWATRQGLERVVLVGGVLGAYQLALRAGVWRERVLRGAGYVAALWAAWLWSQGQRTDANMLAAWLLLTWPATTWTVTVPGLVATGTRGAWLAAAAAAAFYRWRWRALLALPLLAAAAAALVWLRPGTVAVRFDDWHAAMDLWLAHPVLGAGTGAYWTAGRAEHANSLPLTLLAENGLLGLAALGWLAVAVARLVRGYTEGWALLAWALSELTDATLYFPWTGLLAALLAAEVECDRVSEAGVGQAIGAAPRTEGA